MKKITCLLLLSVCCCIVLNAQIKKESILLGGRIFYYNSNINWGTTQPNQKNKSAIFNISIGTALKENAIFGFNISYSPSSLNNFYNGNQFINSKANQYSIGGFYRKYKNLARDFYFFGEFGAAYISSTQTDTGVSGNYNVKYTQSGVQLSITPGLSYNVFKKLQLEILIPNIVSVQYAVTKTQSQTQNSKQNQFLFYTNLDASSLNFLGVGFHFVL